MRSGDATLSTVSVGHAAALRVRRRTEARPRLPTVSRGLSAFAVATSAVLCSIALFLDRSMQFFLDRDSGVYLYTAQRVLAGGVPYRDVWDHKPPLIYYLDALGITLSDLGLPGILLLELAALLLATVFGALAIARVLGMLPALVAAGAWTLTLPIFLGGGNLPEEFALPLQFLAVALYLSSDRTATRRTTWVALGATAGVAILLKPTVVGVWVAIYLCEAVRAVRTRSPSTVTGPLVLGIAGAFAVLAPVGLFFAASGAAGDLIDQVVAYNATYGAASGTERLAALAAGLNLWSFSGLLPVALAGWTIALVRVARSSVAGATERLLMVAALALPIEFALASATGRIYPQTFIPCLPVLSLLVAVAVATVRVMIERTALRMRIEPRFLLLAVLGVAMIPFASASPAVALERHQRGANDEQQTRWYASAYVTHHTEPTQSVLFWGGEAGLNYTTGRRAPTRFAYQYPLYLRGYQNAAQVDQLLAQLAADPPALIVDTSLSDALIVAPLSAEERQHWQPSDSRYGSFAAIERLFAWVDAHYVRVDEIEPLHWGVYAPREASRQVRRRS